MATSRLPLALPADLSPWLGGFALCSAPLLGGRRGLVRYAGRSRTFSSRLGHLVGGALERGLSLAGGVLHRSRHTLRRLSGPDREVVQAIPNPLLLFRIHRGIEQLLCLGADVFAGATEVFARLSQKLPELLFPALVAHGHLPPDDQLVLRRQTASQFHTPS